MEKNRVGSIPEGKLLTASFKGAPINLAYGHFELIASVKTGADFQRVKKEGENESADR